MVQINSNKWLRGLNLNANPFIYTVSKDPYGGTSNASLIADECVLTRQRMVGNRKGFDYFSQGLTAPVDAMWEWQAQIIQHQTDNKMFYGDISNGATRTQYTGTYTAPSGYRMDATVSRGSFYFTTTDGPYKLDTYTGTPARSGMSKPLDPKAVATGSTGWMNGFSKVGYHVTMKRTDANNQVVRSDVTPELIFTTTSRITVSSLTSSAGTATATTIAAHGFSNGDSITIAGATQTQYNGTFTIAGASGSTFTYPVSGSPTSPATTTTAISAEKYQNVNVSFTVPWDTQTGDYYEVWRTLSKDASFADPGDECYLVTTVKNVAAAGATVTVLDNVPDSVLQGNQALYTNASQEGALQGNGRPPFGNCITTYKDYMIIGNTSIESQTNLQMLATINFVANTSSVKLTDTSGTRTYIGAAAEDIPNQKWQIYTGGVSNALNIENSTRSLCKAINGDTSGRWYAEYTSGSASLPGKFRVWNRALSGTTTSFTANDATAGNQFLPALPTSGTTVQTSNDTRINRLFYSKYQQPEAVPILNTIDIGRQDKAILRVVPARDALYVIKADGIWYLSGLSAPFSLIELDSTCRCIAPSTVSMLNNQIIMLSNQGVVSVSTSGVTVISKDIEPVIMQEALNYTNLASVAFGVGQESARQYFLWLPSGNSDTYGTQCYVFHAFAEEWTRWKKTAYIGLNVMLNYTLYIQSGPEKALLKQRNAGDQSDYSDEELPITVVSQTGLNVVVTWPNLNYPPTAGVSLHQTGAVSKVVTATLVTGTQWTLAIDRTQSYTPGAGTARLPIYSHIRLSPNVLGEAGMTKMVYGISFLPTANTITQAKIEVATNEAPQMLTFSVVRNLTQGWGTSSWGGFAWGDIVSPVKVVPFEVDMPVPDCTGEAVSAGWYHSVSQEQYVLAQCSVAFDNIADIEFVR